MRRPARGRHRRRQLGRPGRGLLQPSYAERGDDARPRPDRSSAVDVALPDRADRRAAQRRGAHGHRGHRRPRAGRAPAARCGSADPTAATAGGRRLLRVHRRPAAHRLARRRRRPRRARLHPRRARRRRTTAGRSAATRTCWRPACPACSSPATCARARSSAWRARSARARWPSRSSTSTWPTHEPGPAPRADLRPIDLFDDLDDERARASGRSGRPARHARSRATCSLTEQGRDAPGLPAARGHGAVAAGRRRPHASRPARRSRRPGSARSPRSPAARSACAWWPRPPAASRVIEPTTSGALALAHARRAPTA